VFWLLAQHPDERAVDIRDQLGLLLAAGALGDLNIYIGHKCCLVVDRLWRALREPWPAVDFCQASAYVTHVRGGSAWRPRRCAAAWPRSIRAVACWAAHS